MGGFCMLCIKCLHGGHIDELKNWFKKYEFC